MLIDGSAAKSAVDKLIMSLSAYSIQGKRNHMEDFFDIGYQMKPCDSRRLNEWPFEYFYFGIFDGHGGCEAAKFAKHNLLRFITQQKDFWSKDDNDVMRAIRKGYADTHMAMRQEMPDWCRTSRILPSTAGTTASILFIRNGKFYTGHVGDSRIVISQENPETKHWISRQLTEDHKPESEQEVQRIQRAGGEVRSKLGVHRVVWKRPVLNLEIEAKLLLKWDEDSDYEECLDLVSAYPVSDSLVESYQTIPFLAIARSLGDFWSLHPYTGQYIVSPEPDVSCRPITSNDKCILLATDGLWNVINSSESIRILQELDILKNDKRQYYSKEYFTTDNFYDVAGHDSENHALSLVYFAYQIWERKRLRADNITVVVAMLHDIMNSFHNSSNTTVVNNKSPYITRASKHLDKGDIFALNGHFADTKMTKIGWSYSYMEKIRLNRKPEFNLPEGYGYDDKLRKLEGYLILPPTLLEQEYQSQEPKLVYPINYMRLSEAGCRKICQETEEGDTYVYIKRVSDDPSDDYDLPTRTSRAGKQVKDASAQATQTIHDFGQPWNQMKRKNLDENKATPETINQKLHCWLRTDKKDKEEEEEEEKDRKDEEEREEVDNSEDVEKKEVEKRDIQEEKEKTRIKDRKSIPQLRCLLNYTPPLRRSTRSAYLSVSDNTKRKILMNSSASLSKTKRRKSQPIQFHSTHNLNRV